MADKPGLKRVVSQGWYKDKRYGTLSCGHKVEVSAKEPMPYEAECPICNPPAP